MELSQIEQPTQRSAHGIHLDARSFESNYGLRSADKPSRWSPWCAGPPAPGTAGSRLLGPAVPAAPGLVSRTWWADEAPAVAGQRGPIGRRTGRGRTGRRLCLALVGRAQDLRRRVVVPDVDAAVPDRAACASADRRGGRRAGSARRHVRRHGDCALVRHAQCLDRGSPTRGHDRSRSIGGAQRGTHRSLCRARLTGVPSEARSLICRGVVHRPDCAADVGSHVLRAHRGQPGHRT